MNTELPHCSTRVGGSTYRKPARIKHVPDAWKGTCDGKKVHTNKKGGQGNCPPKNWKSCLNGAQRAPRPPGEEELFELFGHYRELQLGLRKRLDNDGFGAFRGGVARRGHFADQKILRAFQHFLFAEGERLAAAEGY